MGSEMDDHVPMGVATDEAIREVDRIVPVERLRKDGKVAVLVSRGFGAGWSTWNREIGEAAVFDADMARAIMDGGGDDVLEVAKRKYPDAYHGGVSGLIVHWVPEGSRFEIDEYDGSESLRVFGPDDGIVA